MYTRRYALYGALFGLAFPVIGTLLEAATRHGSLLAVGKAQSSPLLWIIDCAPLVLGALASLVGRRQDRILAIETERRLQFQRTASELFGAAQALLSSVSSFSSMTSETAASVRETTATMGQLGHTATKAALTAETVIGLARSSERTSDEGLRAVDAISGELVKVTEQVRGLSRTIEGLNDRMRDIFEIATVVNFVAERSQRLADAAAAETEKHPQGRALQPLVAEMRRRTGSGGSSATKRRRGTA